MPLRICSLSEITSLTWRSCVGVRSAWSRASTSLAPASTTSCWACVQLGVVDAHRAGHDSGVLGGGEVVDGRAEDRDLGGSGRVVVRQLPLGVHAQTAEDRRDDDRDGEHQGHLAPQRPLRDVPLRGLLAGGVHRLVLAPIGTLLAPLGEESLAHDFVCGRGRGAGSGEAVGLAELAGALRSGLLGGLGGALGRALRAGGLSAGALSVLGRRAVWPDIGAAFEEAATLRRLENIWPPGGRDSKFGHHRW